MFQKLISGFVKSQSICFILVILFTGEFHTYFIPDFLSTMQNTDIHTDVTLVYDSFKNISAIFHLIGL